MKREPAFKRRDIDYFADAMLEIFVGMRSYWHSQPPACSVNFIICDLLLGVSSSSF